MKLYKIINRLFSTGDNNRNLMHLKALDLAANAAVITDPDGIIEWVNTPFLSLTGYEKDEVIGNYISDLLKSGKHNPEFYRDMRETVLSGKIWRGTVTNRKKNGTHYIEEQTITPVMGENGRVQNFICVKKDITEKNRIYELLEDSEKTTTELREKNDELERFFTVALDLLCIIDINGTFIRVNRSWERTLGYSMDELINKSIMDYIHPDDIESTGRFLAALSDQIPVLNFTNRYRTNEGDYRFIEWRSYPSGKKIYTAARDITDRIQYEFELNKLAERLTLATESAKIGIWDWNIANGELIWDHQMFSIYGLDENNSENLPELWRKTLHPEDRDSIESLFVKGVKELSGFHSCFRIFWPDGSCHYLEAHALVVREENGRAVRITGVNWDVTESKIMEEKLVTLSTTDPLTSAFNRRYMLQAIDAEISRSARYFSVFSLIMFDLDYFKNVNDTYGHDAGDEVLKKIVDVMKKRIRKNDVLSRWGGEEFMILLSGTNQDNAKIFAQKLMTELQNLKFERSEKITASFGVTEYRLKETSDSVLKRVDELVYRAKKEGRNCIRFS